MLVKYQFRHMGRAASLMGLKAVLPWLWLLLLVSAAPCISCVRAQTAAKRVTVSSSAQLLSALKSDAGVVVLQNDVALGAEFDQFDGAPLQLRRNVTLTGPAGQRSSLDAMPVIDVQNKIGILQLCSRCTFAFHSISIANENRAGTGGGISVFRGQPGSRVEWVSGVGLRPACGPTTSAVALVNSTQRSSLFPSPREGEQLVKSTDLVYRGKLYKDMLHVIDLSSDIVPQQLTNSSFTGGYGILRRNATRLCEHIVSQQCLQVRLPEDCIAEVLAGSSSSAGGSNSSSHGAGSGEVNVAAIAVPVAVGGGLLIAATALLLWRARKRKGSHAQQAAGKPPASTAGPKLKFDPVGSPDILPLVEQGARAATSPASKQLQSSSSGGLIDRQGALLGPWQLLWSSSTPGAAREAQDDIELGVLLGAGSFARVYRGRWSGLDVAVKVIHHDRDSVNAVANEVQLMLSLNHPNIVRAYHCITKQMIPELLSSPSTQQATGSAAGTVSSLGPHTPGLSTQLLSSASTPDSLGSRTLQQRQQPADLAPVNSHSSFVPYISVNSTANSRALGRGSKTAASLRRASASTTGPVTPSLSAVAGFNAVSTGPSATGSTQFGLFSSTVLNFAGEDLDAVPAYQRRDQHEQQQQQQPNHQSVVSGSQNAGSSAVRTLPVLGQHTGSSNTAGMATVQAAVLAGPTAATSAGPTTVTAGQWPVSFAVEPPILAKLQQEYPVSGPNSTSVTSLSGASSGVVSSLVTPPSMSGTGQRPPQLPQLPQQQQPPQVLLPIIGPGSAGSAFGFARSAASRASHSIQEWPMAPGTAIEVERGGASTDIDGTISGSGGSSERAGPTVREGGKTAGEGGGSAAMCETWLVTELCDRGTLARQASQWQPQYNELDMLRLLYLLRDVGCGLKLLNSQSIVHADLNAHNVLVASSPVARHGLVAKVADLGLSRVLKQQATHRTTSTVGMLTHQPPELLQDGRMSPAVDIYSFGIMMFEVFTRQAAYGRLRYGQIYHQVVVLSTRPSIPPDMHEDYELLMKRCWSANPTERPSIDMLLECLELMIEARQDEAGP